MITKQTPIIEVLRSYPHARDIFAKHGMACISCMGASMETIESGAKMHNIKVDILIKELNELAQESQ